MKTFMQRTALVAAIVAGTLGCQSGPRWAWWKKDSPPEDTSAVARSAAPELPSSKATPETVTASTAAPSASSVAESSGSPAADVPASSADTVAAAPSASYPTTSAAPVAPAESSPSPVASSASPADALRRESSGAPAASPKASPSAAPGSLATSPAGSAAPSGGSAGPYDPGAYQTTATSKSQGDSPASIYGNRYGESSGDRYAADPPTEQPTPAGPATAAEDRYAVSTSPGEMKDESGSSELAAASPSTLSTDVGASNLPSLQSEADDRYGGNGGSDASNTAADRYAMPDEMPGSSGSASSSSVADAGERDTGQPGPQASKQSAESAESTVQLSAAPGQYRPGGTSTYEGLPSNGLEIASRPERGDAKPDPDSPRSDVKDAEPPVSNPLQGYESRRY